MMSFDGIAPAADAARLFLLTNPGALPAILEEKLAAYTGTGASPVDLVVNFVEGVYANRDDVPQEAKEIASGLAVLAEGFGFHGMNEDTRGSRIAQVLDGQAVDPEPEAKTGYTEDNTPPAPMPTP